MLITSTGMTSSKSWLTSTPISSIPWGIRWRANHRYFGSHFRQAQILERATGYVEYRPRWPQPFDGALVLDGKQVKQGLGGMFMGPITRIDHADLDCLASNLALPAA